MNPKFLDIITRKDVDCPHKNKKGLFSAATLRKKLKANLKKKLGTNFCDDCARLDPPEERHSVCYFCSFFTIGNIMEVPRYCVQESQTSSAYHL